MHRSFASHFIKPAGSATFITGRGSLTFRAEVKDELQPVQ